jgi:hypothetical protein
MSATFKYGSFTHDDLVNVTYGSTPTLSDSGNILYYTDKCTINGMLIYNDGSSFITRINDMQNAYKTTSADVRYSKSGTVFEWLYTDSEDQKVHVDSISFPDGSGTELDSKRSYRIELSRVRLALTESGTEYKSKISIDETGNATVELSGTYYSPSRNAGGFADIAKTCWNLPDTYVCQSISYNPNKSNTRCDFNIVFREYASVLSSTLKGGNISSEISAVANGIVTCTISGKVYGDMDACDTELQNIIAKNRDKTLQNKKVSTDLRDGGLNFDLTFVYVDNDIYSHKETVKIDSPMLQIASERLFNPNQTCELYYTTRSEGRAVQSGSRTGVNPIPPAPYFPLNLTSESVTYHSVDIGLNNVAGLKTVDWEYTYIFRTKPIFSFSKFKYT